jgi:hypothetical protein
VKCRFLSLAIAALALTSVIAESITSAEAVTLTSGAGSVPIVVIPPPTVSTVSTSTVSTAVTLTSGNGSTVVASPLTLIGSGGVVTGNVVTVNPGALNQHPTIQLVPLTPPRVYPRTEQDSFTGRHEIEHHQHFEHIQSFGVKK